MNADFTNQSAAATTRPTGVALKDVIHVSLALTAILFGNIFIVRAIDIALDAWMR